MMIDHCLTLKATLYGSGHEPLLIYDIGPFETENDCSAWIKRFWEGLDLLKTQLKPLLSGGMIAQLITETIPSTLSKHEVPPTIWEVLDEIETYCQRSLTTARRASRPRKT